MAVGTKANELRLLPDDELLAKLHEAKAELFNLRFQAATGQVEKTHRVGEIRKEIARIKTVLRAKAAA